MLRHQVPLPVPATPSRRLTQRVQTGTPVAGGGRPPPLQAAIRKRSLVLILDPQPLQGSAASGTGPEGRGVSAQAGLTRRTAGSRRSRPAAGWASPPGTPAASCRPGPAQAGDVGWGQPRATRRCEARPQAPLMKAVREPQGTGRRTPGAHVPKLGCKLYQTLSPGPHPENGEGGAGCSRNAPQLW